MVDDSLLSLSLSLFFLNLSKKRTVKYKEIIRRWKPWRIVPGSPPWEHEESNPGSPFQCTLCTPAPSFISLKGSFDHITIILNGQGSLVPMKLSSHF